MKRTAATRLKSPFAAVAKRSRVPLLFALAFARAAATDVAFKLTDAKSTPVADAVVSLVPLDAVARLAPSAAPLEIMQKGQEFMPYVTPLAVGSAVSFPNRDTVQHHVYSLSKPKRFELPLYVPGKAETLIFDQPGVVTIGCNIHDWMLAYVVVLETPWFAKTAADGTTLVASVPPGRYRAEVWHPRLAKPETRELTVADASATPPPALSQPNVLAPLSFTLPLKPDRRIRRTPDSGSAGYK